MIAMRIDSRDWPPEGEPDPASVLVANGRTVFLRVYSDDGYTDHLVSPREVEWTHPANEG